MEVGQLFTITMKESPFRSRSKIVPTEIKIIRKSPDGGYWIRSEVMGMEMVMTEEEILKSRV